MLKSVHPDRKFKDCRMVPSILNPHKTSRSLDSWSSALQTDSSLCQWPPWRIASILLERILRRRGKSTFSRKKRNDSFNVFCEYGDEIKLIHAWMMPSSSRTKNTPVPSLIRWSHLSIQAFISSLSIISNSSWRDLDESMIKSRISSKSVDWSFLKGGLIVGRFMREV